MDMRRYLESLIRSININQAEVVVVRSEKGEHQIPYRHLVYSLSLLKPKHQVAVMDKFSHVENDPQGITKLFKSYAQSLLKIKI